jgi:hypothetical protein
MTTSKTNFSPKFPLPNAIILGVRYWIGGEGYIIIQCITDVIRIGCQPNRTDILFIRKGTDTKTMYPYRKRPGLQEATICQLRREASGEIMHLGTLIMDFLPLEM